MRRQHDDDSAADGSGSLSRGEHEIRRMGRGMLYACWVLVLAFLTWGADAWLERQANPNAEPERRTGADGASEVVLQRNRYGHYVASGEVNGRPVLLMLDTGATDVAVPESLARQLRLEKLAPVRVSTANGYADAWRTRIAEVRIGDIVLTDVQASINPGMNHEDSVLLGMSALKQLEFAQKGDRLVLRRQHDSPRG